MKSFYRLLTCVFLVALAIRSAAQTQQLKFNLVTGTNGISLGKINCVIQDKYGFITLPEEAYFISKAIGRLEWWHLAVVNGGTFLISFLILMIPTLVVRKMQPARAIQF